MIADGARFLSDTLQQFASVSAMLVRGAASCDLRATIGKTDFDVLEGDGPAVRFATRDFIVRSRDLRLDGALTKPRRGDRIREWVRTNDGYFSWIEHEVVSPGGGLEWRPCDGTEELIRIHTKRVGG